MPDRRSSLVKEPGIVLFLAMKVACTMLMDHARGLANRKVAPGITAPSLGEAEPRRGWPDHE